MAAKAAAVPSGPTSGFWYRFQCIAERRVEEGNLVAGERLWEIRNVPGAPETFTIRSTIDPTDFLECSFDVEAGVVTCRPGSAINASPLTFRLSGPTISVLRQEAGECTLEEAIALILDNLVWIEDRCENAYDGRNTDGQCS